MSVMLQPRFVRVKARQPQQQEPRDDGPTQPRIYSVPEGFPYNEEIFRIMLLIGLAGRPRNEIARNQVNIDAMWSARKAGMIDFHRRDHGGRGLLVKPTRKGAYLMRDHWG